MSKLTMEKAKAVFKQFLTESGYRQTTIRGKMCYLEIFCAYLAGRRKKPDIRDIRRRTILGFLDYVNAYIRPRTGTPLAKRTRLMIVSAVRQLYRCLYQLELILVNPLQGIRYRPAGKAQQRVVLSLEEMSRFLDSIDIARPTGLRDRCIFELLYSSALRAGEVVKLIIGDIDFNRRLLLVREAKWGKDRVVPISEVAMTFLNEYLAFRRECRAEPVFLGKNGRLGTQWINVLFKKWLKKLGIYREGVTVHSIRHSVSVHLLAGGADIRYVQELLGHESIETTAGYTNELYDNLKKIYRQFHPRENEYAREVDAEYLEQLEWFHSRLARQRKSTLLARARRKRLAGKKS